MSSASAWLIYVLSAMGLIEPPEPQAAMWAPPPTDDQEQHQRQQGDRDKSGGDAYQSDNDIINGY